MIIENLMAELVKLQPAGTPFNKEQASGVRASLLIFPS
jgi:hypothetical protein